MFNFYHKPSYVDYLYVFSKLFSRILNSNEMSCKAQRRIDSLPHPTPDKPCFGIPL